MFGESFNFWPVFSWLDWLPYNSRFQFQYNKAHSGELTTNLIEISLSIPGVWSETYASANDLGLPTQCCRTCNEAQRHSRRPTMHRVPEGIEMIAGHALSVCHDSLISVVWFVMLALSLRSVVCHQAFASSVFRFEEHPVTSEPISGKDREVKG